MRLLALSASMLLSGCFFLPFGPGGGPGGEVGTSYGYQYCQPSESFGFDNKSIEGQWQDYGFGKGGDFHAEKAEAAATSKVFEFKAGAVTETDIASDGKISRPASGTYSVDGSKVIISWADGQGETVDTYVEDLPGCEMLTPTSVEGSAPRLSTEMYFERVSCDFSKAETVAPATDNTTPVTE